MKGIIVVDHTFAEFKKGVVMRLKNAFGKDSVEIGNKAIKVKASGNRRSADVVVCMQYRRYERFISLEDYKYIPGILIPTSSSGAIKNFPKQHSKNCTRKHQDTNEWFKRTVRIFKNMRSRLVDGGEISSDTAPSYFIEGLLYNVPDNEFGGSYADTVFNCVKWLFEQDLKKLRCANEQFSLLGDSKVQWSPSDCDAFLDAVVRLWDDWK